MRAAMALPLAARLPSTTSAAAGVSPAALFGSFFAHFELKDAEYSCVFIAANGVKAFPNLLERVTTQPQPTAEAVNCLKRSEAEEGSR